MERAARARDLASRPAACMERRQRTTFIGLRWQWEPRVTRPISILRPAAEYPPTLGVVLAGAPARGADAINAAQLRIGGAPMLERIGTRIGPQCAGVLLYAGGDPARLAACGLPLLAEPVPASATMLAGLLAALEWACVRMPTLAWVASVPADCPFLPFDLIGRLHAAQAATGVAAVVACAAGRIHADIGLWSIASRHDLRQALQAGLADIAAWAERCGTQPVDWPGEPEDPFFRVDSLAAIEAAERIAAAQASF